MRAPDPRSRRTILSVVTRFNIGGPAIHTLDLTRGLGRLGYRAILASGRCEPGEGDMSYLLQPTDDVRWIPEMSRSVNPWQNLRALIRLYRLIRAERPDIVQTHTAMAGCLGRAAALLAGTPVIVHTFHGNSLRGYFSPLASRMFLHIERLLARFTDAICVLSEQQSRELRDDLRIAAPSKFRIAPLCLDLDPFVSIDPPRRNGRLRAGWFGRLAPIKNIPLLAAVIRSTLELTDQVEFHIAGDGPERDSLVQVAAQHGSRVILHGWQRDVRPLMAACHVLLQTSLNEGTPVALIQGMASARPFISTAVGGVVDMVPGPALEVENGCAWHRSAVLVQPEPEAFAYALLKLCGDSARLVDMGNQARILAAERYQQHAVLIDHDQLYQDLLETKKERLHESADHRRRRLHRLASR
jgi:glycosyltransferase involved in cell wall biosynthesis